MASKIIAVGAVNGQFKSIFDKISKLHAKHGFSFALIAGDLFANPTEASVEDEAAVKSLIRGEIEIPCQTYFTLGHNALPPQITEQLESNHGEVCPNLYFLGKRSTTKTSEGLRIVALGGSLDAHDVIGLSKDKYPPFHTESDAKSLYGANTADILLTTNWPSSIRNGSKVAYPGETLESASEQCIADLCAKLKPRYHLSASPDAFFEREPFTHPASEPGQTTNSLTRFISLASTTSTTKAKSLYAFNIDPTAAPPVELPQGTTSSPLATVSSKRTRPDNENYSRFSSQPHRPSKRNKRPPPGPSECFFCLSNPNLSTHLITSIATESYLTTARGPLTTSTTYPSLSFPGHVLIIPLAHSPTLSTITDHASRASTYAELDRYRHAIQKMVSTKSNGELGAVAWEVSRYRGVHFHWQFLPVKKQLVDKGLVEAAFRVEAENEQWAGMQKRDIGDGSGDGEYFRVWAWSPTASVKDGDAAAETTGNINMDEKSDQNGTKTKEDGKEFQLVLPLGPDIRFDIQFGRRVMAKLLGLDKRADWKDCQQSDEEEKKDAEAFKETFKQWDFSLDD